MSGPPVLVTIIDEGAQQVGVALPLCSWGQLPFPAFLDMVQDPPTLSAFEMFLNLTGRNFRYVMLRDPTQWLGVKV